MNKLNLIVAGASNFTEKQNSKVSEVLKTKIISCITILIVFSSLMMPIITNGKHFSVVVILGIIFTACISVLIIKKYSVKIKKKYYIGVYIIGISYIINSIIYSVIGYLVIGIIFCIIIPTINEIIINSSINIIEIFIKSICISFVIFLVISLAIGPALGFNQYCAIVGNPNRLGEFIVVVIPACLIQAKIEYDKSNRSYLIYSILLFVAISICLFSNSRIAFLAMMFELLYVCLYLILKYKKLIKVNIKKILVKTLFFSLIFILTFLITFFMLTTIKVKIIKILPSIQITTEYDEFTFENIFDTTGTRYTKGLKQNEDDAFTSGRIGIWKTFYKELNVLGHEDEGLPVIEKTRVYPKTTAHNVYLQIAYSAGIIAGIAMLFLMLYIAINIVFALKKEKRRKTISNETLFSICIAIGFGFETLTSSGYMMYTYLPATFFYFTINNIVELNSN